MTILNDNFERELAQEDGGYESGKWELKCSHSFQKSTVDIPHLWKWNSVFWSCHTTYHSWITHRILSTKTQKQQPCTLPFGVYQLWWWEPCKNQWSGFMTSQYTSWQPTPKRNRNSSTTPTSHGLPPHIYTKHRWLFLGWNSRKRKIFPQLH